MGKKIEVKRLEGSSYAVEKVITGRGASAVIVRAYNLDNLNEELVSKIISLAEEENSSICKAQLQMLKDLPTHPNLVNYKKIQISSENNLYLIMEFCNGGNLEKYLFDCKYSLSEEKIWFFLKQFTDGYRVLYEQKLLHRDIKPENILLHNGDFKIADFGLSRLLTHPEEAQGLSLKGTPIYMAPQLPELKEGSSRVDVFSLGIVLYRMAFGGAFPFFDQGRKYRSVHEYFRQLKVRKLVIPPNNRSPQLVELITRMLNKDKDQRIGWLEIFEHPKIVKAVRCERKKDLTSMEQFKRSLLFVNKSMTKVQDIQPQEAQPAIKQQSECLMLEEAFNKRGKTNFQRKLYRSKMLYTLIEQANFKLKKYLEKEKQLHPLLQKSLGSVVTYGFEFALRIIDALRDVSGEWEAFSSLQIVNFENIFDNDRLILEEQLKTAPQPPSSDSMRRSRRHTRLAYEDTLYSLLTDFPEYPIELRSDLLPVVALLVDIYDQVTKYDAGETGQTTVLEEVEDEKVQAFYNYLLEAEKIKEEELLTTMASKGLIFK